MLSNQPFKPHQNQTSTWIQLLQTNIQGWIRQEIIDEDPCDEENVAAQALYEQFQALEIEEEPRAYGYFPQRSPAGLRM
ncbi:hypothetical protein [Altericista sp. CCNU0014]|uniref:hypothetical protein n=1 Tax=Altericista sp. CCNU0014 TaxID=3082949 RepID=UPI0038501A13